ncbi:hypothetical protein EI77_04602 [Prosthecobacter fusiformis]|uniref:CAAX prenyl protease 2/Lysostaphin resistance protein A-like domain-containing protein n=1 Tax=Prosthecobacter fusiformis TaxID=48464 RepID=A0A4R7RJJ9_9BACT|nr:CPBP family intramembrane glutamic endopeptidase [Prosthecobacter fusiformis]TDU62559.1 hypothetical protein EI77_04602 [Prosthecobacter fusiformis]
MDAPTAGVLRDITLLVWLALLIGIAAYKWVRQTRPESGWNWSGRVDARPYLSMDAIVVAAISILLLGGLQQAVPGSADAPAAEAAESIVELSAGSMFLNIMVQLMICAVLLFYLRGLRNLNPVEIFGLTQLRPAQIVGTALVFMLPTFFLVMGASAGINVWMQEFWPNLGQQDSVEAFRRSHDPLAKTLLVIAAVVIAPIVEETIFRGFIYGVIKRFTDSFFAALCSALLFAVVHFHMGSLIPLALLALIFCAAYERTGSLAVPMLMHGFFNGTSIALMLLFPDMK